MLRFLSASLFLSAVLANAEVAVFSGSDAGAGAPKPNSDAAAARFDAAAAALGPRSLITFENAPPGGFGSLEVARGVTVGKGQSIISNPLCRDSLCGFNSTAGGSQWLALVSGSVTFTFSPPTKAFGAYISGIQASGQVITFNDGSPESVTIPYPGLRGGIAFVGFTDTNSISNITITLPGGWASVDDVRFVAQSPALGPGAFDGKGAQATPAGSTGSTFFLPVTRSGWYRSDGLFSDTFNGSFDASYIVGMYTETYNSVTTCIEHRNFFVFDLSSVTQGQSIVGAQLQAYNPSNGFYSPNPPDTFNLSGVSTSIAALTSGTGGIAAFNALGTGNPSYGTRQFTMADDGSTVSIQLSSAAISALQNARGGLIALGGRDLSIVLSNCSEQNDAIFSSSGYNYVPPQLVLQTEAPALSITESHVGTFLQGETGATYTVKVTNNGAGNTGGTVTVTETVPAGLTLVSMAGGSTWNCPAGGNVCTTTNSLAPGQSYPTITITVNVSQNASSPQINQVTVSGGGSAPATASDATPINPPPAAALGITKSHAGNFIQGKNASYTVIVTNTGGSATSGTVTVTDTLPASLTLVSITGGNTWNCQASTCTRSDALLSGASFPPLTVTVSVSPNAPVSVTNQVSVSGGGASNPASASDTATITQVCSYSLAGSPANVGATAAAYTASLTVTNCTDQYTLVSNSAWITITSPLTGSGSGNIGYSVAANSSGNKRTGMFTVLDAGVAVATFTVNQAAALCSSLSLSPTSFTFGQSGGNGTVNFNTSPCSWTVTGAPSWVVLNPLSGTGTGPSFSFTVLQNQTGAARTPPAMLTVSNGAVTIGTVTITQSGPVCSYAITDTLLNFGASRGFSPSGGGGGINVKAPAGCAWTATTNNPSLIKIGGSGQGVGNGSVSYAVTANTPQSGTITIGGVTYTVTEAAQIYSCSASAGTPPTIRPEGFAELVGDILLTCSGQAPATGITGDIIVSFSGVNVTNLLLTNGKTDALLLEDGPTPQTLALGTNAFQGVVATVNGSTVILFPAVQLVAAGGTPFHTWRITNARLDAESAGGIGGGSAQIQATVSIVSSAPLNGPTTQPVVASIGGANTFLSDTESQGPNATQTIHPVTFMEGFASAYRPRLAANQDPSQAGTPYNAESGYVNSVALGLQTGLATSGTRLITAIAKVPAGVNVYAPVAPASPPSGSMAKLVSADATGAGGFPVPGTVVFGGVPYQPVPLTSGAGTATWEVTASDPAAIEALNFNLLLDNPNGADLTVITYSGALAPVSAGNAARLPGSAAPVPRFASSSVTIPNPPKTVTLSVAPLSGTGQGAQMALAPAARTSASEALTPNNQSSQTVGTINWTEQHSAPNTNTDPATNAAASITLPPTWVLTGCSIVDTGSSCLFADPNNPSNNRMVPYPSLDPGQTETVSLSAESASVTSGTAEATAGISSDDPNDNNTGAGSFTANFPVATVGLTVSTQHSGNFASGQTGATYTTTVTNGGSAALTGGVTLTETAPTGLTLVSMMGQGWTCTQPSGNTGSCTRSDPLATSPGYPPITITVNVAVNAPPTVTNQVVASASSGTLNVSYGDPTNITQCTFSINPTSATAVASAGTAAVSVSTNPTSGCPWTAVSNVSWLTITSGASGSSPGTVNYSVAANTGVARTGTLTIAGQTFTVNQSLGVNHPFFFTGEGSLSNGVYYLQFPNGSLFGFYTYQYFPWVYHFDLGFEYFLDANDGVKGDIYLYDSTSGHWWFTASSLFPYLYDFTLNAWIYYIPDSSNPGHYTTNPRKFANTTTHQIFTM